MKQKSRMILLGSFDLLMALGAGYAGLLMLTGKQIFAEYPAQWLGKLPFESWLIPGVLAIGLFGMGNGIASASCFKQAPRNTGIMSVFMASLLLLFLSLQIALVGEWTLASVELMLLSILQACMGLYGYLGYRKSLIAKPA